MGALFPGVKQPEREADHSPPAVAEVKKMWIYTSTPPYAFMAWCLIRWWCKRMFKGSFFLTGLNFRETVLSAFWKK
jgi:hypothetical protein